MELLEALRGALERHEFFMFYQPIFDLNTQKMVSMEALIRWNHPIMGSISPDKFIPMAEEFGLINPIGNWALRTVCAQSKVWRLMDYINFTIAVNVSPLQLLQPDFPQKVREILEENQLPPQLLVFEITETAMLAEISVTEFDITDTSLIPRLSTSEKVLHQIHDIGISITIDDFGTGYSSFVYLSRLPVKAFKIDKSFVRGTNKNSHDAIIVNALITLGKNLGLNVIAEGIEVEEHFQFLVKNDCPRGQGFYLGKPLSANEMTLFLKKCE